MKMVYDEATGKYVLDITDEQGKVADMGQEKTADMEQGGIAATIEKFGSFKVMDIPLGGVVLGTAGAFLIDKVVVDRLVANQADAEKAATTAMVADLVAAFVIAKYGHKVIGKSAANASAFVLTYEAISGKIATYLDKVWPTNASASQAQPLRSSYEVPQVFEQGMRQSMNQPSGMQNTGGALGAYAGSF